MKNPEPLFLESLESRIAPASFTFTDVDGDTVTVATSKGLNTDLSLHILQGSTVYEVTPGLVANTLTSVPSGFDRANPAQLLEVDLTATKTVGLVTTNVFEASTLSITAKRTVATPTPNGVGNGFVNAGFINAVGLDLGAVTVRGDLGRIIAGDGDNASGVASLTVQSFGRLGTTTQDTGGDLESIITGKLGALTVKTDIEGATINVLDGPVDPDSNPKTLDAIGAIGNITIGGSLLGGATADSGKIHSDASMGTITISGDIRAGSGAFSGAIESSAAIAAITVKGSLIGGADDDNGLASDRGTIQAGTTLGATNIIGDIKGGGAQNTGSILANSLTSLKVGGSIIAGNGNQSGIVNIDTSIGAVTINGNLTGSLDSDADDSGVIKAGSKVTSITINGNVYGGAALRSGGIFAGTTSSDTIGAVTIKGNLIGGDGDYSGSIKGTGIVGVINIGGSLTGSTGDYSGSIIAGTTTLNTLGNVTIKGEIIGGSGSYSGLIQSSGSIGLVAITGSVTGKSGDHSGSIDAGTNLKGVTIGGGLLGGSDEYAGSILVGTDKANLLGAVKITGDLKGGSAENTGVIVAGGSITSVTINGSVRGTNYSYTANIIAGNGVTGAPAGTLGAVVVTGSILGGNLTAVATDDLVQSAFLTGFRITSLTVGGSIVTGVDLNATYSSINNAAIRSANDIGAIKVTGSLTGNFGTLAADDVPVLITALGQIAAKPPSNIAISSLTVGGNVAYANILAGYRSTTGGDYLNTSDLLDNKDGQIGAVTIGGDFKASNLVAGSRVGVDGYFGTSDDVTILLGTDDSVVSKIASLSVGGQIFGTSNRVGDNFGIVAELIGSVKVGGTVVPLVGGQRSDSSINDRYLLASDVRIFEALKNI